MTTYAIISLAGKQFRVSEGQRLLVDRLGSEEGTTITPPVLLVGGDGGPQISPEGVTVTARVVGNQRGPKIRIGKYKKRTGYRRRTGFRAALTQIEIESISGAGIAKKAVPTKTKSDAAEPKKAEPKKAEPKAPAATKPAAEVAEPPAQVAEPVASQAALPEGYGDMTIAQLKSAALEWDAGSLQAALEYEQAHSNRKGAVAALESAIAKTESG
jgi:large subunit ribosomal protein L21